MGWFSKSVTQEAKVIARKVDLSYGLIAFSLRIASFHLAPLR